MQRKFWLGTLALLGTHLATAQAAPRNDTGLEPQQAQAAAPRVGTLRVFVDPVTHEIATKPADPAQRRRAASKFALTPRNDDLMWIEHRADGGEFLHTEGQVLMNAVARPNGHGEFEHACLPGAETHLAGPTP